MARDWDGQVVQVVLGGKCVNNNGLHGCLTEDERVQGGRGRDVTVGRQTVNCHSVHRGDQCVHIRVVMRARNVVDDMQDDVEYVRGLWKRHDWPQVIAKFRFIGFRRDEFVETIGRDSEDLRGMHVEKHTVGGE